MLRERPAAESPQTRTTGAAPLPSPGQELRYTAAVAGPDPNPDDPLVRLGTDEELDFAGLTVVVHGVAAATDLPVSVRGIAGVAPHRSVPVACGVIEVVR